MGNKKIKLFLPSKVNLYLSILEREKSSGLHFLNSIICPTSLADELEIELSNSFSGVKMELFFDKKLKKYIEILEKKGNISDIIDKSISTIKDNNNLAVKATNLYMSHSSSEITTGVFLKLKKKIPFGAGLGGGSVDAAGVLLGLNLLSENPLTKGEILDLARLIGTDVFAQLEFCLCEVSGVGDKVRRILKTDLKNTLLEHIGLVIISPGCVVRTVDAYKKIDELSNNTLDFLSFKEANNCLKELGFKAEKGHGNTHKFDSSYFLNSKKENIFKKQFNFDSMHNTFLTFYNKKYSSDGTNSAKDFEIFKSLLANSFDDVISSSYKEIKEARELLAKMNVKNSLITGSGSAICCYFPSYDLAARFSKELEDVKSCDWFISVARLLPDAFNWAVAKW